MESKIFENKESADWIKFEIALKKLGQAQYVSWFINPHPKLREEGIPYFDDIRIEGNPDNYYGIKIHKDDIEKFIQKWLEYKKTSSPFYQEKKVEDYL
jgi:hypothetical protein